MRAYGKRRQDTAGRNIRGTSIPCPCCVFGSAKVRNKIRANKKSARQIAKNFE